MVFRLFRSLVQLPGYYGSFHARLPTTLLFLVLKPTQEHCPLCHRNIPQGEESWKSHLMGSKRDACPDNPRRLPSINRRK